MGGQGLGNDRELLQMLTMDTGKSQKGHGGHQENIQLPETEGNLRFGFPPKRPYLSEKVSGRVEPQPLPLLLAVKIKEKQQMLAGRREFFRGKVRISPQSYGDGPLFPEIQALSFHRRP